jgi:hypothetical protein
MPEQNITLIAEQEAGRLCPNDSDPRRREFQRAIVRSLRAWEAYRLEDPNAMEWDLLGAVVARVEADNHPSSEYFQERMSWARGVCMRLYERDGVPYIQPSIVRSMLCRKFAMPGFSDPAPRRAQPQGSLL